MLERSVYSQKAFKEMSKYFVFCKINTDQQRAVAEQHGVKALPTLKFLKNDGSVFHTQVGAMPLRAFIQMMNDVRTRAGME